MSWVIEVTSMGESPSSNTQGVWVGVGSTPSSGMVLNATLTELHPAMTKCPSKCSAQQGGGGHPLTHSNSQKIKNKKNLKKIAKMNRAGMGEGTDRGIRARMGEHRLSHLPTSHFSGNILTPN